MTGVMLLTITILKTKRKVDPITLNGPIQLCQNMMNRDIMMARRRGIFMHMEINLINQMNMTQCLIMVTKIMHTIKVKSKVIRNNLRVKNPKWILTVGKKKY